jgi:hypothetical protein
MPQHKNRFWDKTLQGFKETQLSKKPNYDKCFLILN